MTDIQSMEGGELIDPLPQQQLESLAKQIYKQLATDQDAAE
jgi:hypothetical protein